MNVRPLALASLLVGACAAQHADAPSGNGGAAVVWESWSPETFAKAKAQQRLVLVDVVAEWCHWCHVMDKTTYADPRVRSLLAANFVAVRVDSDARPDVAERYRDWGWPATGILTPDAEPVLELRGYQEPAPFAEVLQKTVDDFHAKRPIARKQVARRAPSGPADLEAVQRTTQLQLDAAYDQEQGGWGRPQKYPISAPVEQSLFAAYVDGDSARRERALRTLGQETRIIDPVWGGIYQYSTNGDWEHPHFEKIVPVQAGAISNFAQAYGATGDKRWLEAASAVKRYVRDFLTAADGAFLTSQDADVGAHGDAAKWTDGHEYFPKDDAARRAIGIPRIDANVYADRNGLLIRALCELYEVSGDSEAIAMARRAALRIAKSHAGPVVGLTHGEAASAGATPLLHLADQVEMGSAFLALAQANAEPAFIARAETIAQTLRDRFEDRSGGGFFEQTYDPRATGTLAERRKPFVENARAARFLLRLNQFTGEELWKDSAVKSLRAFADPAVIADEGRDVGDYLLALQELAHPPIHLNVVGKSGTKETTALYRAAIAIYSPGRMVKLSSPGDEYPDIGKSAVYVCSTNSCSPPITDPERLAAEVQSTTSSGR